MRNKFWNIAVPLLPLLIALLALWQGVWQHQHIGAVVFYGDDTFGHLEVINGLKSGALQVTLDHPALLEWKIWKWSSWFNTDIVRTYTAFAILSLPLMIASTSLLAYRVFSPAVGVLTAFILAVVSIQPVQSYQDGTIPNIYAIGVLFPLALLLIYEASRAQQRWKKVAGFLVAAILLVAIAFTHHLSTLIIIITFAAAALLFSIWLAIHLQKRRFLSLLPVLGVAAAVWVVLAVVKPAMVLRLLSLVVAVKEDFPWVFMTNPTSANLPWTAVRFGEELSGLVFQLAIFSLPLLILKSWRERAEKASIMLILFCWTLLYWVGSVNTFSFEPSRLARDLAIPGAILSAYAIWWVATAVYPRYKPAALAFFVIALASAYFSAGLRWNLASNHPKTVYTAQDEEVVKIVAPYKDNVAIYSPNYFWQTVATNRGHHYVAVQNTQEMREFARSHETACVIQLYYKIHIAGGDPDPNFAAPLLLETGYILHTYEDSVRRLFLSCRPAAMPIPSSNQKI